MNNLIEIFDQEKECEYKGNVYSVRDNGAVMRHAPEGKKARPLDNKWSFGTLDIQSGYFKLQKYITGIIKWIS